MSDSSSEPFPPEIEATTLSDGGSTYGDSLALGTVGAFGNEVAGDQVTASGAVALTGREGNNRPSKPL